MLETEIKNLSTQIEQLNANFAKFFTASTQEVKQVAPPKKKEVEAPEPAKVEQVKEQPKEKTRDDLRELCLVKVRSDRKLKDKIFDIFNKFDSKVVDDLKDEDIQTVFTKVSAL